MPQNDYVVDNQLFPATRTDINNVLNAIVTQNSGATAPSVTYPFQMWADTSTNPATIRQRNAGNTAWVVIGVADTVNWGLATIVSPGLTGTPTTPTVAASTNTNQIASTAFVQNAIANNPAWINVTLFNGWLVSGGFTISYRKLPTGAVVMQGVITRSTPPQTSVIFNLPVGFRPVQQRRFSGGDAFIDVTPNGDVSVFFAGTIPTTAFVSLDIVRFEV